MSHVPPADELRSALRDAMASVPASATDAPPQGRVGAVLVLFAERDDGTVELVLTRRRRDMRSHPGQLSFPGGRVEEADEGTRDTALREAAEETGLRPDSVTVVGEGRTFYLPPSRFWVAPIVAWWDEPHELEANPDEVDEVVRVPLAHLLDPERWRAVPLSAGGSTWAWQLDDDLLWGATAIVTALLLDDVLDDWSQGTRPEQLGEDRELRPWEDAPPWTPRTRLPSLPSIHEDSIVPVERAGVARVLSTLGRDRLGAVSAAAAGAVVDVCGHLLDSLEGAQVTVLVGPAGTGRVGLDIARLLLLVGTDVTVRLSTTRDDLGGIPDHLVVPPPTVDGEVRFDRRGVEGPAVPEVDRPAGDLIVDALIGPGAEPPLHGGPAVLALWAARHDRPVVAVALPSGVAADTGLTGPSLHADVTIALGMPTAGLLEPIVAPYAGEIVIADVGIPPAVYNQAGVRVPRDLFDDGPLVRLERGAVRSDAGTPDQGPSAS